MSTSRDNLTRHRHITPPSIFNGQPLTPPLTVEKPYTEAPRVIAHFRQIQAGRDSGGEPLKEFQLVQGEYEQIERTLLQDDVLSGYVKNKIRYDYDGDNCTLVVRMPTEIHERFIDAVEDDIRSQLKAIRSGSDRKARFAQKVRPARSTEIRFAANALSSKSKYEPDASFRHDDAQYPGVIIEVAYSQKESRLGRLADNYIIDSDANVQAVVCLDIEYGKRESRKATLSIWRPDVFQTPSGPELRAVEEPAHEAFRDDEGHPVDHPGLQLRLSDFAYEELARKELGDRVGDKDQDPWICISGEQLCQYLDAAESKVKAAVGKQSLAKGIRKRKRSETPPDEIRADDEEEYAEEEKRAAKRTDYDPSYEDSSSIKSVSD
ncbi:hypothetical protein T440DRAFT_473377 [Plenodomus tracheiphilus IPT5]|uniref:Uncharacterized protein n=1 Tax=Plenodomus tracheiphilus IPT5 TaxID=1408161 RepID=A0A6A7ANY9_9PLEO|nr:hypothetical protein T440DRAFT_473377 [Plenodomus tracheiphilus IPT5]